MFTTIQKFLPEGGGEMAALIGRENIVVIVDEAHRSQYGYSGRVNEKGALPPLGRPTAHASHGLSKSSHSFGSRDGEVHPEQMRRPAGLAGGSGEA